ncbi:facilitated trehalose transporter Tret1 [Halyomorpha halys]|uniref:facilitated trehalose transporter Tret1 n=1 Tax=Halyomorpha halys TaxID=286706 RepID=UPI0006D4CA8F|nr:facilitated trehalose transporter Tret1 [Halyomorpha halys]
MASGVLRQFLASFCINISVFIAGNTLGWPSPVLYSIQKTGQPMNMSHSESGLMVSMLYIGNFISPIPSGALMDMIGRKMTIHVLTVIPMASWVMVYFAKQPIVLHLSRLLAGSWLGTVITVIPTYVGEVSEPKVRGAFSTFFQLMANVGVLYAYIIGPLVDYHMFTIILGSVPIIFVILMFYLPESPYWLTKKGEHDKAAKALSWLRGKPVEEIKKELSEIEDAVTADSRRSTSYRELVATRGNRKAFMMVEVIAITQRASGISALMAYVSTSLPEEGPMKPNECVIVIGFVLFFSVFMSTSLVDRSGRRPLLMISSWGCALFMFLAALWFFLDAKTDVGAREFAWVPFVAMIGYSFSYCVGLGPLQTTIQGEVFPTNTKGHASGITAMVLALVSFGSNIFYLQIADSVGMYMNFVIFTLSSVIAALFVQFFVIETKGRSLHQIQKELNEKKLKLLSPVA